MQIFYLIIFTFIGSIFATFLGSILGINSLKFNKELVSGFQNFAIGAIIGLLFIELIPEGISSFISFYSSSILGATYSVLIILGTGLIFFFIHELTHLLTHHHDENKDDNEICENHGHTVDILKNKNSISAVFIFLLAIAVHNIPEGLSFGISFTSLKTEYNLPITGFIMTLIFFIHNILIGLSMGAEFKKAGKSSIFSILMTTISAMPSFIFALIGYFINYNFNELTNAIIYSISSGCLLYVLIIELLPQVFYEHKSKYSFIYLILGILVSIILLYI